MHSFLALIGFFGFANQVLGLDNGLLLTPPMGINTWFSIGTLVNESFLVLSANHLMKTGLRDAGYTYINVDDGWTTNRDSNGRLQADPLKFPNGMKHTADLLHNMTFKFGLYGASSSVVCSGRPGSLYLENIDAQSYAQWGIDYIKQDNCGEYAYGNVKFQIFADAVNATGKYIAISSEPFSLVPNPFPSMFANLYRTGNDVDPVYEVFLDRFDRNHKWAQYVKPGAWADPDMLQCGRNGLTDNECRTNFGLACITKSPLIIGGDILFFNDNTTRILSNKALIAVNQDPLGKPATKRMIQNEYYPYYVGITQCVTNGNRDELGMNGITPAGMEWEVKPRVIDESIIHKSLLNMIYDENTKLNNNSYVSIYHPSSNRCLSYRYHPNRPSLPIPVLLPCSSSDPKSVWLMPNPGTLTALINVDIGLALSVGSSSIYGSNHGSDTISLLDDSYGITNLTFTKYIPPPACNDRNCDSYDPTQTFYISPRAPYKLYLALFSSNSYHCFASDASCYFLTQHLPTFNDLCLAKVASIENDPIEINQKGIHIWAGPLANGDIVLGVENRNDLGSTDTTALVPFEILSPEGYDNNSQFCGSELFTGANLGLLKGSLTLNIQPHDMAVVRLSTICA